MHDELAPEPDHRRASAARLDGECTGAKYSVRDRDFASGGEELVKIRNDRKFDIQNTVLLAATLHARLRMEFRIGALDMTVLSASIIQAHAW
jgi:hypothetical protein